MSDQPVTWQQLERKLVDAARHQGLRIMPKLMGGKRGAGYGDYYVINTDGTKIINLTQLAHDLTHG